MGRSNRLYRTSVYGCGCDRYGVLRHLDEHMVVIEIMKTVLIILILAVIVWWPRKGGKL